MGEIETSVVLIAHHGLAGSVVLDVVLFVNEEIQAQGGFIIHRRPQGLVRGGWKFNSGPCVSTTNLIPPVLWVPPYKWISCIS